MRNLRKISVLMDGSECKLGVIIVDYSDRQSWTISTTGLKLLRTLERDYTPTQYIGDQLVPCCGNGFIYTDEMDEVCITGCPSGKNWTVQHLDQSIRLITEQGTDVTLPFEQYKNQVLLFVDQVEQFYKESQSKVLPDDQIYRDGYLQFWNEWHAMRNKWNYGREASNKSD